MVHGVGGGVKGRCSRGFRDAPAPGVRGARGTRETPAPGVRRARGAGDALTAGVNVARGARDATTAVAEAIGRRQFRRAAVVGPICRRQFRRTAAVGATWERHVRPTAAVAPICGRHVRRTAAVGATCERHVRPTAAVGLVCRRHIRGTGAVGPIRRPDFRGSAAVRTATTWNGPRGTLRRRGGTNLANGEGVCRGARLCARRSGYHRPRLRDAGVSSRRRDRPQRPGLPDTGAQPCAPTAGRASRGLRRSLGRVVLLQWGRPESSGRSPPRRSASAGWAGGRKVRTPTGSMLANGEAWRRDGKCNREQTAGLGRKRPGPVRVKGCGKSAPLHRRRWGHGKPHAEQDQIGGRNPAGRPSRSRFGADVPG